MKKVLVVFFGKYMQRFLNEKPPLDESFFKDEKWWPVRPNSTNSARSITKCNTL